MEAANKKVPSLVFEVSKTPPQTGFNSKGFPSLFQASNWNFKGPMLRLLQLHWLFFTVTTADSDVNDLLQIRAVVNYSSPEALKELAEVLVVAKKECLGSSVDCIGTLKQVGIFGWLGGMVGKGKHKKGIGR